MENRGHPFYEIERANRNKNTFSVICLFFHISSGDGEKESICRDCMTH